MNLTTNMPYSSMFPTLIEWRKKPSRKLEPYVDKGRVFQPGESLELFLAFSPHEVDNIEIKVSGRAIVTTCHLFTLKVPYVITTRVSPKFDLHSATAVYSKDSGQLRIIIRPARAKIDVRIV